MTVADYVVGRLSYGLQGGENMAHSSQTVFVLSTDEAYGHARTHGQTDDSKRAKCNGVAFRLNVYRINGNL